MIAERMDVIDDMPKLQRNFSLDKVEQDKFRDVVLGQAHWTNDELDEAVIGLRNMLSKVFKQSWKSEELLNDLLK